MFKLGAKNSFLLCLLIKKKLAIYSAERCNFLEPEIDCSRNGNNLYKSWVEGALNSGPFGHFRFANHHFNRQILIKVWTSVIGLSCLIRTILEYKKVRQIWTLLLGKRAHVKKKSLENDKSQTTGSLVVSAGPIESNKKHFIEEIFLCIVFIFSEAGSQSKVKKCLVGYIMTFRTVLAVLHTEQHHQCWLNRSWASDILIEPFFRLLGTGILHSIGIRALPWSQNTYLLAI